MSLDTVKASSLPPQKERRIRLVGLIDNDQERRVNAESMQQNDLSRKFTEKQSSFAKLVEAVKGNKVAFNFMGTITFPLREGAIYFGKSFRDVTKILRERGHKVIYHDPEENLDGHTSSWIFSGDLKRDFSGAVASNGTCFMSVMPGELAKFYVPTFEMAKRSLLERSISLPRLMLSRNLR